MRARDKGEVRVAAAGVAVTVSTVEVVTGTVAVITAAGTTEGISSKRLRKSLLWFLAQNVASLLAEVLNFEMK